MEEMTEETSEIETGTEMGIEADAIIETEIGIEIIDLIEMIIIAIEEGIDTNLEIEMIETIRGKTENTMKGDTEMTEEIMEEKTGNGATTIEPKTFRSHQISLNQINSNKSINLSN